MRRRLAAALSIGALIILYAPVRIAMAQQTAQFLDDAPITFKIVEDSGGGFDPSSKTVTVAVAEATDDTVVTLTATGDIENLLAIDPDSAPVERGRANFTVTPSADSATSEAGTNGQLVALTSDGAVARLQVSITADTPTAPTLPSSLTLTGLHWNLFLIRGWTSVHSQDLGVTSEEEQSSSPSSPSSSPAEQVATEEESPATVIGIVASENGDTGSVRLDGDVVSVHGIEEAGEYKGKADLTPGQDGGEVDVTVKMKDFFFWPLVTLVLGLGLVLLLEWFAGVDRPGFALKIRLRSLQVDAENDRERARAQIAPHFPDNSIAVPIVYRRDGDLLLNSLVDDAIIRWRVALDQADRDYWKPSGDGFKFIRSQTDNYRKTLDGLTLGAQLCSKARELANELEIGAVLSGSPIIRSFRELLVQQELHLSEELVQLQKVVDAQTSSLSVLKGQLQHVVDYLKIEPGKKDDWQKLGRDVLKKSSRQQDAMWTEIDRQQPGKGATSEALSKDEREELLDSLGGLDLPIFAYSARSDLELGEDFDGFILGTQRVRALTTDTKLIRELEGFASDPNLSHDRVIVLSSDLQDRAALEPIEVTNLASGLPEPDFLSERPEDLRKSLARVDSVYTILAGVVTVLSGLSALYLTNATFGTIGHYVSLFVWGSAFGTAAEAVKKYLPATR